MRHPRPAVRVLATALLLVLAGVFALLAASPGAQAGPAEAAAAAAAGLWLAAAAWAARPLVGYLRTRRRFRVALSGE